MPMMASMIVILLFGFYLIGLAIVSVFMPKRAASFLLSLAKSAPLHYLELLLRFIVAAAMIIQAPEMSFSGSFSLFAWILIFTTTALFVLPWRWHCHFAQRAVPNALRHLRLLALASFLLGGFVLVALFYGKLS